MTARANPHLAASAAAPPPSPVRRYELSTTGRGDVLTRVIGLVRRRCGEVVALEFRRGDRHRPPVLELAVAIDGPRGRTLAARLAALIDVLDVREL
jgi:acetolactate synthase regulatory subunit